MNYVEATPPGGSPDSEMPVWFLARARRRIKALSVDRWPEPPTMPARDWYRMNAAANALGEFWGEILLHPSACGNLGIRGPRGDRA